MSWKKPVKSDIDFINIRERTPPYVPEIASDTDTSNFDPELDDGPKFPTQAPTLGNSTFSGKNLPFAGFTFSSGSKLSELGMKQLLTEKSGLKSVTPPPMADIDETVKQLEESAKKRETELQAKLKDATQKIDEISLECDQLRSSKSSLLKKYEQKVFDENEALYRKLRRSENDLRLITSQIDQLRLDYQAQEDAKRKLQDELKLAESQRQEQDTYVKNIKADYDKLLVSKNEDYKYSNRIEHLQNELDKKQDELFEAKKVTQKAQLRHEAECDELQRRLDEAVDTEAEKNKLEVQRLEADYDQRIRDLRQEKTELENDLAEAKNQIESQKGKEQWEQYLGNIVQWVYDEKDARAYLEQLANRMSDELEALKEWSDYFLVEILNPSSKMT